MFLQIGSATLYASPGLLGCSACPLAVLPGHALESHGLCLLVAEARGDTVQPQSHPCASASLQPALVFAVPCLASSALEQASHRMSPFVPCFTWEKHSLQIDALHLSCCCCYWDCIHLQQSPAAGKAFMSRFWHGYPRGCRAGLSFPTQPARL